MKETGKKIEFHWYMEVLKKSLVILSIGAPRLKKIYDIYTKQSFLYALVLEKLWINFVIS